MITKEDEYKAEICKIGGLAFIAPLGKETLNIPYIELFEASFSHILYIVLITSFAGIGIYMILKGTELMRERNN